MFPALRHALAVARRRGWLPVISETERAALEAGTVWLDGDFFHGRPDFVRRLAEPWPELSRAEREFLAGPVEEVCRRVQDAEITARGELPAEIWEVLRREGFFGLMLPPEYGGRGFSALGASTVFARLASRSLALSAVVLIPNSVGPGELLLAHGTAEQRAHWLPRLARGQEIPCFALTEPTAGSDAAALRAQGRVVRREDGSLGLVLEWEKRYITLAPVATLLGLAFRLRDPENLLGLGAEPGITLALVPTHLAGVDIGRHHDPMGVGIPNGPTRGDGVEVGLDAIVGGAAGAGRGWRMLMEALSAGRAVSLPAQAAGGTQQVARVVGAYAALRQQFGRPVGRFEGVAAPLARIAGWSYLLDAARVATCGAITHGERPAVLGAALKVAATELARAAVNDGMDVLGGAGICLGPRNLLARGYFGAPIGITVEGSNVLTRSLIVFGQGLFRAHPHAQGLLRAAEAEDVGALLRRGLAYGLHLGRNLGRGTLLSLTRGRWARSPVDGPTAPFWRRLSWAAERFATVSDLTLLTLGAELKARELHSGRLADALTWQYLTFAALRRFEAEGRPAEDLAVVTWAAEHGLHRVQEALEAALRDFPRPGPLGWLARHPLAALLRLAPLGSGPRDATVRRLAAQLQQPGSVRDRWTALVFRPPGREPGGVLETALAATVDGTAPERLAALVAEVIRVDDFAPAEYRSRHVRPLHAEHAGRGGGGDLRPGGDP